MPIGYRHCDPRFPFLWQSVDQPAARWHGAGEGPANYFADTPSGAWAEFLRHEGITEAADLAGVRRSLWAVELPDAAPDELVHARLPERLLLGNERSYAGCQAYARLGRTQGRRWLQARGAALLPGQASGWTAAPALAREAGPRDGTVWVYFGPCDFVGWPVVEAGQPPAAVLGMVRPLD